MERPRLKVMLAGIAVLLAAGFTLGGILARSRQQRAAAAPAAATKISINNFSFTPDNLRVPKGTTVTWVNHDDVPHTVVSSDKTIKSKALDTDDTFSFTFTQPGTYDYYCSVHPKMTAKVTVK